MVTELCCEDCAASIKGRFELPDLACLSEEDNHLLIVFLSARGNVKEVERSLGISYPTVKSRLEAMLSRLGLGQSQAGIKQRRLEVLVQLERGEIAAQEAVRLLNGLG